MRDLEIRGAGSLLGAEQSGNLSAVGFDLFAQMLMEAVSEARGEPRRRAPRGARRPAGPGVPARGVRRRGRRARAHLPSTCRIALDRGGRRGLRRDAGALRRGAGARQEPRQRRAHPGDGRRGRSNQRQRRSSAPHGVAARRSPTPSAASSRRAARCGSSGSRKLAMPLEYGESVTAAALGILDAILA